MKSFIKAKFNFILVDLTIHISEFLQKEIENLNLIEKYIKLIIQQTDENLITLMVQ